MTREAKLLIDMWNTLHKEYHKVVTEENYDILKKGIKALEQEPCEDCVSRQAVTDAVENTIAKYIPIFIGRYEKIPLELAMAVKELPPVTPKEPKTGYWIKMPIGFKCSKCTELESKTTKYCPNCGAKMESDKE